LIRRPLGSDIGLTSAVGLGTWAIGGWKWGGTDEAQAISAIQASIDAGVDLIDTAPAYGMGLSEEIVGKAIRGRRDRVIVATKCGMVWHTQQGNFFLEQDGKPIHRFLGAESVRHEVEQSLRRLGIETIDLLQTHWQDATTPIEETMRALMDLRAAGKIRAIGVCNATTEQMDQYRTRGVLASDQERYSMLDRGPEADLLPYVREHGIAFLAYSPLALGLLTGKVSPDRSFPATDLRSNHGKFETNHRARVNIMLEELRPLADGKGLTVAQLVLRWTLAQPGVSHVLVGARNAEQASANAKAGEAELSPSDVAAITTTLERHFSLTPA
jgi:aryl-alcohol dehydrogenase-like predicted oxidoreductase